MRRSLCLVIVIASIGLNERLVIGDGGDEIGGVVLARRTSLGFRYEVITRSRTPQTKNSKTKLKLTTQTHCWSESM